MSFAEYKKMTGNEEKVEVPEINISNIQDRSGLIDTKSKTVSSIIKKTEPKELFKRKKNERLSNYDNLVGPFYIDPKLMDKFRVPKKCNFFVVFCIKNIN